jgi:cobalt transporter subunit CbtA
MKNTIAAPALVAGLLAALLLTLIQTFWVSPLILQAETFENAPAATDTTTPSDHHHDTHDHSVGHHHEHAHEAAVDHHASAPDDDASHHHDHGDGWQPEDGWQRVFFTGASNLVMAVGYALVLVALFHWRKPQTAIAGIGWGIAGFAVFFGAPSLGLPPELPGTAAAELVLRQAWWIATALCTAIALGLVFFRKDWFSRAIALALLVAPHIYGAPQPASHESLAPAALLQQFVIATSVANAVFWLVLGVCTVWLYRAWYKNVS